MAYHFCGLNRRIFAKKRQKNLKTNRFAFASFEMKNMHVLLVLLNGKHLHCLKIQWIRTKCREVNK